MDEHCVNCRYYSGGDFCRVHLRTLGSTALAPETLLAMFRLSANTPCGSAEELDILNKLSEKIDAARETNDQKKRAELYEQAMGYVLDLAVELPVYQRDVLYAYNANVINSSSLPSDVNPYSSPLDRIWELEFAN